jgi:hypothetical protein
MSRIDIKVVKKVDVPAVEMVVKKVDVPGDQNG